MPIGKNAIKRVTSNTGSSVKSEAPDMENSEVVKAAEPVKAKAPAKKSTKTSAQKQNSGEIPSASEASKTVTKKTAPKAKAKGKSFFGIGDELPIYLL